MGEPNDRDREVAYILDGYDDDRLGTVASYRAEIEAAARKAVLEEVERWADEYSKADDSDSENSMPEYCRGVRAAGRSLLVRVNRLRKEVARGR